MRQSTAKETILTMTTTDHAITTDNDKGIFKTKSFDNDQKKTTTSSFENDEDNFVLRQ